MSPDPGNHHVLHDLKHDLKFFIYAAFAFALGLGVLWLVMVAGHDADTENGVIIVLVLIGLWVGIISMFLGVILFFAALAASLWDIIGS